MKGDKANLVPRCCGVCESMMLRGILGMAGPHDAARGHSLDRWVWEDERVKEAPIFRQVWKYLTLICTLQESRDAAKQATSGEVQISKNGPQVGLQRIQSASPTPSSSCRA